MHNLDQIQLKHYSFYCHLRITVGFHHPKDREVAMNVYLTLESEFPHVIMEEDSFSTVELSSSSNLPLIYIVNEQKQF